MRVLSQIRGNTRYTESQIIPNTRDDVVWVIRRRLCRFETLGYESLGQVSVDDVKEVIVKMFIEQVEHFLSFLYDFGYL